MSRLNAIYPAGGSAGKTIDLLVTGADLDDANAMHFSQPGIAAKPKMALPGPFDKGPVRVLNAFEVTIAANVPVGIYDARVVGKYGASNPRAFLVSDLPAVVEVEPNDKLVEATEVTLPMLVGGQADRPADVDCYKFTSPAGQRIIVDCLARRLDSNMDMIVAVYDPQGRELDSNRDSRFGDPLLDFTTPAAGDYSIKVHDALYRGNDPTRMYTYELAVGALPHIDFVFPPAALAGSIATFTVYGRNLPGGEAAGISIDGKPLQRLRASMPLPAAGTLSFLSRLEPEHAEVDAKEYRIKGTLGWSNPVQVGMATAPVVVEVEPNTTADQAQKVAIPCEVAGQFYPANDEDWFSFDGKKDEVLWIEVISQRQGLQTDPSFVIQQITMTAEGQPQVKTLIQQDDAGTPEGGAEFDVRHDDPAIRFVVPADGVYRLLVRDAFGGLRSDPRSVYRLSINGPQPDFRLAAVPVGLGDAVHLRKGGRAAFRVVAFRRGGFNGEITVTAAGLPGGTTLSPGIIGPDSNAATLVVTAADNAPAAVAQLEITGAAQIGAANVTRPAHVGALVWALPFPVDNQPQLPGEARIGRNLILTIADLEPEPATVAAGADKVWEVPRAGIVKIPYTVVRRNGFAGNIVCTPVEMPKQIASPAFTIAGNAAAGEFQLTLNPATPVGTYTFYLNSQVQAYSYARNPEAAKAAADRKVEIDKYKVDADAAALASVAKKTAADQLAIQMAGVLKTATDKKAAADKLVVDSEALLVAATQKATQTKADSAKAPTDVNLANLAKTAEAERVTAATNVTNAKAAVVVAQKELEVATTQAKAADDAKVLADKENTAAIELVNAANAAKAATDKLAVDTANAAKPVNRNLYVPSTPITLKFTPAPLTLAVAAPATPVKQSTMLELPVTITRLYAYADQVTVSAILPPGVGGLAIPNVNIPANQTEGKLVITAAADATPGKHELTIRISLRLNNLDLTVDQPVAVTVEKVEPTK